MNTASAQSVKQVLSAVSGFAYNIELYSGKQDNSLTEAETDCGASSNVVTRLVRNIPDGANYKLYFDNYFNSPELQLSLATKGISSLGTVRTNRLPGSQLPTEVQLKKMGRGYSDWQHWDVSDSVVW